MHVSYAINFFFCSNSHEIEVYSPKDGNKVENETYIFISVFSLLSFNLRKGWSKNKRKPFVMRTLTVEPSIFRLFTLNTHQICVP